MASVRCIVHRGNRVLMMKAIDPKDGIEFWHLPGGATEEGETPAEAAVRELKEECLVNGAVVHETSTYLSGSPLDYCHTFLIDIGNQEPQLGSDPEYEIQALLDVKWVTLAEISERDRAFLWASGIFGIEEFVSELLSWSNDISYPKKWRN